MYAICLVCCSDNIIDLGFGANFDAIIDVRHIPVKRPRMLTIYVYFVYLCMYGSILHYLCVFV